MRVTILPSHYRFMMMSAGVLLGGCTIQVFYKPSDVVQQTTVTTDVIEMNEQQLDVEFWTNKITSDDVQMTPSQISDFNQQLFTRSKHMKRPLTTKARLSHLELSAKLNHISKAAKSARFYASGKQVTPQDYQRYQTLVNREAISRTNIVEYALVIRRTPLRTFPTLDRIFKRPGEEDLDRFQESALFAGEAVAVLHHSRDKAWYLVQNYHYIAWVQANDIAIGDKTRIEAYINNPNRLLVTGSKAITNFVPNRPQLSNVGLDMGVSLALADKKSYGHLVFGQNQYNNHVVNFPIKNAKGQLDFVAVPIAKSQDVTLGFLALTQQNILRQSFKFLGERYGWGHDFNGRDCTGFIGEVYKSFGLLMPRNSGQQGKGMYGETIRFKVDQQRDAKIEAINHLAVGDLIYISGHVMMYIGEHNQQPYVIHDVHGLSYFLPDGQLYQGKLNSVSVTPLLPLRLGQNTSYLDSIYAIKRLVPVKVQ